MAAHVGKIAMTPRPGKRDAALCFRGRLWERLRLERWRWHRPVVEAVVIAAEAKRGRHDGRTCWRANDEICAPEEGEQACLCKQPFGSLRQLLTPSLRPLPPMRTAKLLAGRRPVQARDRSAAQHGGAQHGHPPTSGRVGRTCGQPRRDARVCFACSQREETERSCGVNSSRTSQVANLRALQYTHVAVSVVARRRRQTHAGTGGEPYRHAARARGASRAGPCARPRRRPCLTHRCRVPANARSVTVKGICRALRRTVHLARGGMFPASSQPARRAGGWPKHRRQRSRPPFSADVQPRARCLASRRARAAAAFARGPFSRWWKPAH